MVTSHFPVYIGRLHQFHLPEILQEKVQMINNVFQEHFTANSNFVVNNLKITNDLYSKEWIIKVDYQSISISNDPLLQNVALTVKMLLQIS